VAGQGRQAPRRQAGVHHPGDEVLEAHVLVAVVPHGQALAVGADAARRIEPGGEDAQVRVRHEHAEQQDAVARLDVVAHRRAAHPALVEPEVGRLPLPDHGLAHQGVRHRDAAGPGQAQQPVLQPVALHVDARQDDRLRRRRQPGDRLGDGLAQALRVARRPLRGRRVVAYGGNPDHIPRDLQVDRAALLGRRRQDAVDVALRGVRVVEHGRGHGELLEDPLLGVEVARLVVQQGVRRALGDARRAADHHHRRALGEGLGGAVGQLQPADAVGHADHPQPPHPGVDVRGEPGPLLVCGVDQAHPAVRQQIEEAQHEVPGDAEDVADAARFEPLDQILPDAVAGLVAHDSTSSARA
jgi:hypothetical protein